MAFNKVFSSLTLKVFLGFWFIALSTMFITRWISIQIVEFDRVSAITEIQQQQIDKVSKRLHFLAKKQHINIIVFLS